MKNGFEIKTINLFQHKMMTTLPIVSLEFRKTKDEIVDVIRGVQDTEITPEILLMIDYAFHNTDDNYDHGLSFLDRLHKKLSKYFDLQWNIPNLKDMIRSSTYPCMTYLDILNEILTDKMIMVYGV